MEGQDNKKQTQKRLTHIPTLKVLGKVFFKLGSLKGNVAVTVINSNYPRLSWDYDFIIY